MANGCITQDQESGIDLRKKIYLALIIVSILAIPHMHTVAKAQRGYEAIGGEYLLPLVMILISMAVEQFFIIMSLAKEERDID